MAYFKVVEVEYILMGGQTLDLKLERIFLEDLHMQRQTVSLINVFGYNATDQKYEFCPSELESPKSLIGNISFVHIMWRVYLHWS